MCVFEMWFKNFQFVNAGFPKLRLNWYSWLLMKLKLSWFLTVCIWKTSEFCFSNVSLKSTAILYLTLRQYIKLMWIHGWQILPLSWLLEKYQFLVSSVLLNLYKEWFSNNCLLSSDWICNYLHFIKVTSDSLLIRI